MKILDPPDKPEIAIFADFDGTYLHYSTRPEYMDSIKRLEILLKSQPLNEKIFIGWVSGSSYNDILDKASNSGLSYLPHFIASSLGSELRFFDMYRDDIEDSNWVDQMNLETFNLDKIKIELDLLKKEGFNLVPQSVVNNSPRKISYYYFVNSDSQIDRLFFDKLERVSVKLNINIITNKCCPGIGDPEDAYDIDIIPKNAGKIQIVKYICNKFNIDQKNTFAFGDNTNDFEMINYVKNGFLVANADQSAKNRFQNITKTSFSEGIIEIIKEMIL